MRGPGDVAEGERDPIQLIVTQVHPLLSALGGPLCPFNQKAQRKAPGTG